MGRVTSEPRIPPACSDTIDNDEDGVTDYPFDPGCAAAGDLDETDSAEAPVCLNELDDDDDGIIDFPLDQDADQLGIAMNQIQRGNRCSNGIDDDNNGRIDYPDDPGCAYAADPREGFLPRCTDGIDNDLDGLIDPEDVGCGVAEDDETDLRSCQGVPMTWTMQMGWWIGRGIRDALRAAMNANKTAFNCVTGAVAI